MIWAVVALGGAALAAVTSLAVVAIAATRRAGNEQALHAELAARLEATTKERDAESARADDEKARANALDDLLAHAAVAGPVDGAFDRLLQTWRDARAAHRAGAGEVPPPAAAGEPGPDELLPPGA